MNINRITKYILPIILLVGLIFFGCDKTITNVSEENTNTTMTNFGTIGVEYDDASGVLNVFVNGEKMELNPNALPKLNATINDEVSLTNINATSIGCQGFDQGFNVRTIAFTFTKSNSGNTVANVYSEIASTINVNAIHGMFSCGDNLLETDEELTVSFDVIVGTCTGFTFFFDLEGTIVI